jgi:hypothetical protein
MALKGDRREIEVDVSFFNNDVAERGIVLVYGPGGGSGTGLPGGSGAALDDANQVASVAANPSGLTPAGLLLNNQVQIDQTRQHINFQRDEMIAGGKCALLRRGWVVTNKISGSPTAGNKAYLSANGSLTPTKSATGGTAATPLVGEFMSAKDADGYAKVEVNLPASA